MVKYLNLEELDPQPPDGFKPFGFRLTKLDSSKKVDFCPKGDGQYSFLKIKGDKISVLRTDNYHKALNFNFRALDISPPKETHIGKMDTLEFTKWKLLRSLENFVHFLVRHLAKRTKYFIRLCRKLRYWLRNSAFKAAYLGLSPYCKGKPKKPTQLTYPFPNVLQIRTGKVSTASKKQKETKPRQQIISSKTSSSEEVQKRLSSSSETDSSIDFGNLSDDSSSKSSSGD